MVPYNFFHHHNHNHNPSWPSLRFQKIRFKNNRKTTKPSPQTKKNCFPPTKLARLTWEFSPGGGKKSSSPEISATCNSATLEVDVSMCASGQPKLPKPPTALPVNGGEDSPARGPFCFWKNPQTVGMVTKGPFKGFSQTAELPGGYFFGSQCLITSFCGVYWVVDKEVGCFIY